MKLIKSKHTLSLLFFAFFLSGFAQEVIKEKEPEKKETVQSKRLKVDGIIATVGDYTILDSDIDKAFLEIEGSGGSTKDITRCQMLGKLLEDKLYAHQAIQDSIVVKDEEIKEKMNQQIDYMVEQLKSMDAVVKYFKKNSEDEFKTELFEILKQQRLASEMQKKIIDPVQITPEETRNFFKKIPENERPLIGTEIEIAQIVVAPKVSQAEKQAVIDRLKEIKKQVQEGASFTTKAVLYTEDPGSRSSGGFYKINKKTPFVKEFKDVAYSLQEGEISEPFETEFGFHIIYLEKIKGQDLELRHILMVPKVTPDALKEAKDKIELIKKRILDKEITFAEAARTLSDEKETRANGGTLINPKTQDSRFELTNMDPEIYSQVSNMKSGEISNVILDEDPKAGKRYKIMMVTNKIEEHTADFSKDYTKIKELALKEKQINAIAKWSEKKIKETYIKINGEYKDCTFTNNWLKK
ncbi:peptidylprolyl isomerase [Flavobacterium aciduliphilum]|uniref:Periplasmic chaperone for outer membrane proteins SurA n=1 Tax=Flavobacterium aciduliphilum TaxID=1101402 RepID=A0A328Z0M9_9FLAO|nr:peptidylprolyl isomerase [Flavobacterium aciduliphilum]RAR75856.1 periplasmic chaperone for outer membrane proteins SurA [Flavobacterium aciduliphilum]